MSKKSKNKNSKSDSTLDLQILLKKREVAKNKQSSFKLQVESFRFLLETEEINNIESRKITELELRYERQVNLLKEFEDVQVSIECLLDADEEEVAEREVFENEFYESISLCKNLINDYYSAKNKNVSLPNLTDSAGQVNSDKQSENQNIKLPQIQLPKFSGSYDNWLEFRDTFDSLINENNAITPIQKFHYLRAALEGGAAQVIRSLEFSAVNYPVAWNTLLNRYNNDSLLVSNHVKSIFNIPSLQLESAFELRKMLDVLSKHLQSLKSLGQPVQHWDTLIIYILTGKLDKTTAREWEEGKVKNVKSGASQLPTLDDFKLFLKNKADFLETLSITKSDKISETNFKKNKSAVHSSFQNNSKNSLSCIFCKERNHHIQNCPKFIKLHVSDRIENTKRLKLCINCLRGNHLQKYCYAGHCKKCSAKHNTLLHIESNGVGQRSTPIYESNGSSPSGLNNVDISNNFASSVSCQTSSNYAVSTNVLLSTAIVLIKDSSGSFHPCRVLLDSGSQSHFISDQLCNRLRIKRHKINMSVTGINQINSSIDYQCSVSIQSVSNSWNADIVCLIVPVINNGLPNRSFDVSCLKIPSNIKLADPSFSESGPIDLLIGAGLFYNLLCIGQISLGQSLPILQKTVLGWIVSGAVNTGEVSTTTNCNQLITNNELHEMLQRFWLVEEPSIKKPILSKEESLCEEIFQKTTTRDVEGRFIVQIPLKDSPALLGDSKQNAYKRLKALESKLSKNSNLSKLYSDFLQEYLQLNHMSRVEIDSSKNIFFLPHHGIYKENNQTTKLRVVFDGSTRTDSGISLNDIQLVGPTIQNDLVSILMRFRQHTIVVCADIVKMYRQILICPEQRRLQQILWRTSPSQDIQAFQLNTVTYGTASAPWLAVRCLKQLSIEHAKEYPKASKVILNDFYMDDLLTGCDTLHEAISLTNQIVEILRSGCFSLQKWASNSESFLNHIKAVNPNTNFKLGETERTKTLGLYWCCSSDSLMYSIGKFDLLKPITKRSILSDIAQVFDPLGLVSPCIVTGKIILQELWLQKLSWDEALPSKLHSKWFNFRQELPHLNGLQIPRMVCCKGISAQIHAFCDSSNKAYGSCIYIRSVCENGDIQIRLLYAKSRVAPLKSLTVPKLELCGALLSAQLIEKVTSSMNFPFDNYFLWCDSTVCIGWICTPPNLLKPFVQNRVAQIQSLTNTQDWYHVKTKENPADILSRGATPSELLESTLWWQGPGWLNKPQSEWPISRLEAQSELPELKNPEIVANISVCCDPFLIGNFSCLIKLQRVVAYAFRFINNCSRKDLQNYGPLTVNELNNALWCLVKIAQRECFATEISQLSKGKPLSNNSKLLNLNPFIDENNILRVGGRLQMSLFSIDKKHPAILSSKHSLAKLIMKYEHKRLFHCGAQHLLASMRERFWPLGGRSLARSTVHGCFRCFRINPKQGAPIMGVLPSRRICPALPFSSAGVDFAGPIAIKSKKGRGAQALKAYICLFICLVTKAVHIEVVSDLTKDCFISAFRRFCSRRGKPSDIYSDNGSTFVGARSELTDLAKFLNNNQNDIQSSSAAAGVNWHFIPSYSPHMGGIWEAGVKSAKSHLKRVMGNALLTFEEITTVMAQIEAILNSRPITPISSDPNDFSPLTPSHFLIGRPATSLPDPDLTDVPVPRLSRYQHLQQIQQHFWKRWSTEFISELQTRTKWKTSQEVLSEGALVVIRDNQTSPLQWRLGRILSLHYGPDGVARVAEIKTSAGVIKRSFSKICVLPIEK